MKKRLGFRLNRLRMNLSLISQLLSLTLMNRNPQLRACISSMTTNTSSVVGFIYVRPPWVALYFEQCQFSNKSIIILFISMDLGWDFEHYYSCSFNQHSRRMPSTNLLLYIMEPRSIEQNQRFNEEEPSAIEQSKRINDYAINKQIGSGAFGVVYECTCPTDKDKKWAIKVVSLNGKDQKQRNEVKKEGNLILRLEHKNVLQIEQCFFFDNKNKYAIVMPVYESKSLKQCFKSIGSQELQATMVGIAQGLAYLHAQKVIHRDLKMENILMLKNQPIIADFGLSKLMSPFESISAKGTLTHFSPQVFDKFCGKAVQISQVADVWSLGLVFLELLSKKSVYEALFDKEMIAPCKRSTETLFSYFGLETSEQIKALLAKMLVKQPKQRFQAAQVLSELKTIFKIEQSLLVSIHSKEGSSQTQKPLEDSQQMNLDESIQREIDRFVADQDCSAIVKGYYKISSDGRRIRKLKDGICYQLFSEPIPPDKVVTWSFFQINAIKSQIKYGIRLPPNGDTIHYQANGVVCNGKYIRGFKAINDGDVLDIRVDTQQWTLEFWVNKEKQYECEIPKKMRKDRLALRICMKYKGSIIDVL